MLDAQSLKKVITYDHQTGRLVWIKSGKEAGAKRPDGYVQIYIDGKCYRAHRLAWLYVKGAWPADEIDHINGDPSDNRYDNLREATSRNNKWNTCTRSHNKLGVKGVQQVGRHFSVRINTTGKTRYVGMFKSLTEAKQAYLNEARKCFGEFACGGEHFAY